MCCIVDSVHPLLINCIGSNQVGKGGGEIVIQEDEVIQISSEFSYLQAKMGHYKYIIHVCFHWSNIVLSTSPRQVYVMAKNFGMPPRWY